jgi:putative ABC transport system permease protein
VISNYTKIAWRNILKNKTFSFINLVGLSIGMASFLLIAYFVKYELTYDQFIPQFENIYRVTVKQEENNEKGMHSAMSYAGITPILLAEVPEVESAARILVEEVLLHNKTKHLKYNNQKTYWADGDFHKILSLKFELTGDLSKLDKPNHAILSSTGAKRLFGSNWQGENSPIGKTIWLNEGVPFMIQGVYKDIPDNSHLAVDFIVSYSTLTAMIGQVMETAMPPGDNFDYTYVKLKKEANLNLVNSKINAILTSKIPDAQKQTITYKFDLQNIADIHLRSNLASEIRPSGNRTFVYALAIAALLILIIALSNFINLNTAKAIDRAREIGIRKSVGAGYTQLMSQFVFEGFMFTILSALFSLTIVAAVLNTFKHIVHIDTPLFAATQMNLWAVFGAVVIAGALLASLYPAFILSSFQPIKVLKGKLSAQNSGSDGFRKSLIIVQFCITIFLLCATGAIFYQIAYMKAQPTGMDSDAVLVVHTPRSMIGNEKRMDYFKTFRQKISQDVAIKSVASSACLPGKEFLRHKEGVRRLGVETGKNISYDFAFVDEGYCPTLGVSIIAGRNFSEHRPEDSTIIINETAVKSLGFKNAEDAIDKVININEQRDRVIVGVIKDVHYKGLQNAATPLLLSYGHNYEFGFFTLKINTASLQGTIARVKKEWDAIYPNDPFDTFFLDDFYNEQYQNEQAFGKLFSSFALLAILIASLGLFGLVMYTVSKKQKEIAVRKVLGAKLSHVFLLITTQYFKYIIIALIIALPFSHFMIYKWLNNFATHFEVKWWMYVIPIITTALICVLTVSRLAIKAAYIDPVKALKMD